MSTNDLALRRVVIYRNGVAYFERSGHVEESEVHFKVKDTEVGDFLATLAVSETGGSSVRSVAFPMKVVEDEEDLEKDKDGKPIPRKRTEDEKRHLKNVVLGLDGKAHDLEIGYVAEAPVWRPSYRLVVEKNGEAYLQAWGVVQNLSGEDWRNVKLSLVAGAPLAFEAQLGEAIIPERPIVTDRGEVIASVPKSDTSLRQESEQGGPKAAKDARPTATTTASSTPPTPTRQVADLKKRDKAGGEPIRARAARRGKAGRGSASRPEPRLGTHRRPRPRHRRLRLRLRRHARRLRGASARSRPSPSSRARRATICRSPSPSPTRARRWSCCCRAASPARRSSCSRPTAAFPTPRRIRSASCGSRTRPRGCSSAGPIAVFERGSFLGQGMVDPLPAGATATVPFALERGLAVDQEQKRDELGERIAKIENGELTIERDDVRQTKYRLRNGSDLDAKMLLRHPRINGARLHQPPPQTEDNVGTQTALVPAMIKAHATSELVVDERLTNRRREDWFTVIADNAVKAYLADSRADRNVAAKLTAAWVLRKDIVERYESRGKLAQEQATLSQQSQETRANLRAIEKNKSADALRVKLTARLAETATRIDEVSKRIVEIDAKLAELRIQFKELLRGVTVVAPLPPK